MREPRKINMHMYVCVFLCHNRRNRRYYLSRRWGNRAAVPHTYTPQPHHTLIHRQLLQHTLIQTHTHHSRRNRGNRPPLRRGNRAVVPQINHSSSTHSYTHSRTTAEAHTHTHTHTHTHHSHRNRGDYPLRRRGNRAAVPHIYRSHSTHSYTHTHTTAAAYTHPHTRAKVHIRTPYTHTHTLYLQYTLSHTHIPQPQHTLTHTHTHTIAAGTGATIRLSGGAITRQHLHRWHPLIWALWVRCDSFKYVLWLIHICVTRLVHVPRLVFPRRASATWWVASPYNRGMQDSVGATWRVMHWGHERVG